MKYIEKLHIYHPFPPLGNISTYIGADPEIFVADKNGTVIPAFSFLKDQRKHQRTLDGGSGLYSLHNDGFQAEFTVLQDTCLVLLVGSVRFAMRELLKQARQFNPDAQLVAEPTIDIPEELLLTAPLKYVKIGCQPSNNIYNYHGEPIVDGKYLPIRFAGSHMHLAMPLVWRKPEVIARVVKAMDCLAGVLSVALFGEDKNERVRRRYYGLPGEFRTPTYGVEYRSISAAMLRHPVYYHLLFDFARFAMRMGGEDRMQYWWTTPQESVVKCMMGGSQKLARAIIKAEPLFGEFLKHRYRRIKPNGDSDYSHSEKILAMILGTAKLKSGTLMENWALEPGSSYDAHSDLFKRNDRASFAVIS